MTDKEAFETISIPVSVFNKLRERIKGTRFLTVSEYVTDLLTEIVAEPGKPEKEAAFSKEDEEAVDKRLRALGYLD